MSFPDHYVHQGGKPQFSFLVCRNKIQCRLKYHKCLVCFVNQWQFSCALEFAPVASVTPVLHPHFAICHNENATDDQCLTAAAPS